MTDIICCNILDVDKEGITLAEGETKYYISFNECAKNYAIENTLKASKCVAIRDITKLTFTFYTTPKTKVIFKKHFLKDIFYGKTATSKFLDLQRIINQLGYTSYDIS